MFAPPNWKGRARHSGQGSIRPLAFLVPVPIAGRAPFAGRPL